MYGKKTQKIFSSSCNSSILKLRWQNSELLDSKAVHCCNIYNFTGQSIQYKNNSIVKEIFSVSIAL